MKTLWQYIVNLLRSDRTEHEEAGVIMNCVLPGETLDRDLSSISHIGNGNSTCPENTHGEMKKRIK